MAQATGNCVFLISVMSQANSQRTTHGSGLLLPRDAVLTAVRGLHSLKRGDQIVHRVGDSDADALLEIVPGALRLGGVLVARLLQLLKTHSATRRHEPQQVHNVADHGASRLRIVSQSAHQRQRQYVR